MMKFERYADTDSFAADVLEILMENEVQNNLPISFLANRSDAVENWLLGAVKDDAGSVVLTAACTPPFNLVLYETRNTPAGGAAQVLSDALKELGYAVPGVMAEQGLARRFAEAHAGMAYENHMSMNIMRLDAVADFGRAPGVCRPIREEDMFYLPFWTRAFGEECGVEVYDIPTAAERLRGRLGTDTNYVWEDGIPVSQAVHGRSTPRGAVVNYVYTPPFYRGRGYAASCVAALSQRLLDRGNQFCALFADAKNPISNGIYRKIGYRDVCIYDALKFV